MVSCGGDIVWWGALVPRPSKKYRMSKKGRRLLLIACTMPPSAVWAGHAKPKHTVTCDIPGPCCRWPCPWSLLRARTSAWKPAGSPLSRLLGVWLRPSPVADCTKQRLCLGGYVPRCYMSQRHILVVACLELSADSVWLCLMWLCLRE